MMTEDATTTRLRRMELTLLERDRRIRELEEALAMGSVRCPFCGTQVTR